jgi:hypothetical protein
MQGNSSRNGGQSAMPDGRRVDTKPPIASHHEIEIETESREHGDRFADKLAGQRRGREKANRARAKIEKETETQAGRRPLCAYTVHNLDTAIAHLEIAMSADKAMAIFGPGYWHGRVLELRSTPGILFVQERRLRCLLDRFAVTG